MTREITKTWEKRAPWDKSNHYIICAVLYSDTLRVVDDLSSILSLFASFSFSFLPEYHNYNSNHNNQLYCYVTLVRSPVGCGSEMDIVSGQRYYSYVHSVTPCRPTLLSLFAFGSVRRT